MAISLTKGDNINLTKTDPLLKNIAALDPSEIDVILNIVGSLEDVYEPGHA